MNISTYIFGQSGKGYTQYPLDCNNKLLQHCAGLSRSDHQLIIHRVGRLMYYTFVMFLTERHDLYIGISLSLSDVMITRFEDFYHLFLSVIERMAVGGEILTYDGDGIVYRCSSLNGMSPEINEIEKYINTKMVQILLDTRHLPPLQYGLENNSIRYCSLDAGDEAICNIATRYAYTVIAKERDEAEETSEVEKILYPEGKKIPSGKRTLTGNIKHLIWKLLR